jgi:multidrug resistance efflux pump
MYLTLGPDVMRLDGNRHDAELAEAKASAASRWYRLVDLEAQVQRETANLAARPKNRPSQPADDQLPDRTIEKQARDWEERTKGLHVALADLRKLAAGERKELKGFISKKSR